MATLILVAEFYNDEEVFPLFLRYYIVLQMLFCFYCPWNIFWREQRKNIQKCDVWRKTHFNIVMPWNLLKRQKQCLYTDNWVTPVQPLMSTYALCEPWFFSPCTREENEKIPLGITSFSVWFSPDRSMQFLKPMQSDQVRRLWEPHNYFFFLEIERLEFIKS